MLLHCLWITLYVLIMYGYIFGGVIKKHMTSEGFTSGPWGKKTYVSLYKYITEDRYHIVGYMMDGMMDDRWVGSSHKEEKLFFAYHRAQTRTRHSVKHH